MIDRHFREHPRSVGETYVQHLCAATSFAGTMMIAGLACFIHAIIPSLFEKTGSAAIERLHARMIVNRRRAPSSAGAAESPSRLL